MTINTFPIQTIDAATIVTQIETAKTDTQAARDAAALSAAQAALYEGVWLDTAAAVLADTALTYTTGQPGTVAAGKIVRTRAEGFSYEVAASGATVRTADNPGGHDVTTAGGVKLRVLPDADGKMSGLAFGLVGDGLFDNTSRFTRAMATGRKIKLPKGRFFAAQQITFTVDHGGFEGEAEPTVDLASNTFVEGSGTIIQAMITSNNLTGTTLRNLGVDTRAPSLNEGIVITNFIAPVVENVTVLGSNENNHCCLMQAGPFATVRNVKTYGGKQGVAFKGTFFDIDGVIGTDATIYNFTIRHDATPCFQGSVKRVKCRRNLLAASACGGFVAMNDDVDGAAMRDIVFDDISVDECKTGIFVLNGGNNTPARRLRFNDVNLRGIPNFAFQTFGDTGEIDVDGITVESSSAAVYTNLATGNFGLNIRNLRDINNTFASDISGSGHRVEGWILDHPTRTKFIDNRSTNLQVLDMDMRVPAPVSNVAGGTVMAGSSGVVGPAIGSLYAIRYDAALTATVNQSLAQNDQVVLFTNPDNFGVALVNVHVLSGVGRHVATYLVTGQTITKLGASQFQNLHFDVVVSGTEVRLVYLGAATQTVTARAFYSRMVRAV